MAEKVLEWRRGARKSLRIREEGGLQNLNDTELPEWVRITTGVVGRAAAGFVDDDNDGDNNNGDDDDGDDDSDDDGIVDGGDNGERRYALAC